MPDALAASDPASDPVTGVPVSLEVLTTALADAVLATPGVLRLEPTLSTSGPRLLLGRRHADGLHILNRAGIVDVDVDVATSNIHQARRVALHIQSSITETIAAHGYTAGSIAVSILAIDAPDHLIQ